MNFDFVKVYTCDHKAGDAIVDVAATCGKNGSGHTVCTVCNVLLDDSVVIPATGKHTAGELIVDTAATCTATGTGHKNCTVCGGVAEDDIVISIDADAHKWESEYTIDIPATCYAEGYESIHCEYCDTKKADSDAVVPVIPHNWSTTLSKDADNHYYECLNDGCTDKKDVTAHTAGELIVDTAATCKTAGVGHKACTACGEIVEENIPVAVDPDNHAGTTTVKDALAATCGADGYSGDTYCDDCSVKLNTGAAIPATGKHSWDNGVVTKEPTTTKTGVKTYTCSVCKTTKTETLPKKAAPVPKVSFTDVKKSDFYYDAVQWAVALGVTTGTSKTTFGPSESCTRAQAVTFLWRAAGQPAAKSSGNPFKDIKKSDYYYKAVLWAAENGVTSGTTKTTFGPNEVCTRGQIVTFLWRAQGAKKVSASNPFKDIKKSDFYYNAVLWAVKNGVTTGTSATTFGPSENCTRGQIVTFLHRAVAK